VKQWALTVDNITGDQTFRITTLGTTIAGFCNWSYRRFQNISKLIQKWIFAQRGTFDHVLSHGLEKENSNFGTI